MNKETYISRRAKLKKDMGSGLLLFLGNDGIRKHTSAAGQN